MGFTSETILNDLAQHCMVNHHPCRAELFAAMDDIEAGRLCEWEMSYDAHWIELRPDGARIGHHYVDEEREYPVTFAALRTALLIKQTLPDNQPMQRTAAAGIFSTVRKWFGRGSGR
jgi:hypothetical protein